MRKITFWLVGMALLVGAGGVRAAESCNGQSDCPSGFVCVFLGNPNYPELSADNGTCAQLWQPITVAPKPTVKPLSGVIVKGTDQKTVVSVTSKNGSDPMSPCVETGKKVVCKGDATYGIPIGQCAEGTTGYAVFSNASCVGPTPTIACKNLWWFDNTTRYCSQKSFCGAYTYGGLRTFSTLDECRGVLGVKDTIDINASCGGVSMAGQRSVTITNSIRSTGNLWQVVEDTKTKQKAIISYNLGWDVNKVIVEESSGMKFVGTRESGGYGTVPVISDGRIYSVRTYSAPYIDAPGVPVLNTLVVQSSFLFKCPTTGTPTPKTNCSLKKCGDANCDGKINTQDLIVWISEKNGAGRTADFNNDGVVDSADYGVWKDGIVKGCKVTPTPTMVCKTGVNSFGVDTPCSGGYRYMTYACYDGFSQREGGGTSCKSSDLWSSYAKEYCKNRSNCSTVTPTSTPVTVKYCTTNSDCSSGQICYQPPMPTCGVGVVCPQVMPAKYCRGNEPTPTCHSVVTQCASAPCPTAIICSEPPVTPTPTPAYGCHSVQTQCDKAPCPTRIICSEPPVTGKPTVISGCNKKQGDADGDGKATLKDYAIWRYEYGTGKVSKADFNCDKKVDLNDYAIWKTAFLLAKSSPVMTN